MTTIPHLTTSANFIESNNTAYSQTIIDKFIEACLKLDVSIFEPFMHEDDVFEDREKYTFLGELHGMFDQFAKDTLDDFTVTVEDSHCNGCVQGYPIKHFKVFDNETNTKINEFAFLIETEDGMLKDIYRCYEYEGCKMITLGGGISNLPEIKISYELLLKEKREYLNSQK